MQAPAARGRFTLRAPLLAKLLVSYLLVLGLVLVPVFLILRGRSRDEVRGALQHELAAQVTLVAQQLGRARPVELAARIDELLRSVPVRVTVVGTDGRVLGDSTTPAEQLENHIDRPEIHQALASGRGGAIRYSATTGQTMIYAAQRFPRPRALARRGAHGGADLARRSGRLRRALLPRQGGCRRALAGAGPVAARRAGGVAPAPPHRARRPRPGRRRPRPRGRRALARRAGRRGALSRGAGRPAARAPARIGRRSDDPARPARRSPGRRGPVRARARPAGAERRGSIAAPAVAGQRAGRRQAPHRAAGAGQDRGARARHPDQRGAGAVGALVAQGPRAARAVDRGGAGRRLGPPGAAHLAGRRGGAARDGRAGWSAGAISCASWLRR